MYLEKWPTVLLANSSCGIPLIVARRQNKVFRFGVSDSMNSRSGVGIGSDRVSNAVSDGETTDPFRGEDCAVSAPCQE